MLNWLRKFFPSSSSKSATTHQDDLLHWNELVSGDYICVHLKDPKQVGIISHTNNLTYQRLDADDIKTRKIYGFVIRTERQGVAPARIDYLELNAVKKQQGNQRLVTYFLLKEEIEKIEFIGEHNP